MIKRNEGQILIHCCNVDDLLIASEEQQEIIQELKDNSCSRSEVMDH